MLETCADVLRVAERQWIARQDESRAHERLAEFREQRERHGMIGYADADRAAALMLNPARRLPRCGKQERIRSRSACLEQAKLGRVDARIPAGLPDTAADEREVMIPVRLAYPPYPLERSLVADLAAERVAGVGRVGNDASLAHDRCGATNEPRLGIRRVEREQLTQFGTPVEASLKRLGYDTRPLAMRAARPPYHSCMQNALELATLAVFVVAYYLRGIYTATAALMAAVAVVLVIDVARARRVPLRHGLSAVLVFLFGAATLLLHNRRYIEWKPTIFFWLAAAAFLGSFWIGKRPLVARFLGPAIDPSGAIPERLWRRLNALWVAFYLGLGVLNVEVAYHASERTWVDFKVFGLTLATAAFIFVQVFWLARRAAPAAVAAAGREQIAQD